MKHKVFLTVLHKPQVWNEVGGPRKFTFPKGIICTVIPVLDSENDLIFGGEVVCSVPKVFWETKKTHKVVKNHWQAKRCGGKFNIIPIPFIGIGPFSSVAFPIVRKVFPTSIASQIVSVQPMSMPSGLLFYMDYKYGGKSWEDQKVPKTNQKQALKAKRSKRGRR